MSRAYFDRVVAWAFGQMAASAFIALGFDATITFCASLVSVLLATALWSFSESRRI